MKRFVSALCALSLVCGWGTSVSAEVSAYVPEDGAQLISPAAAADVFAAARKNTPAYGFSAATEMIQFWGNSGWETHSIHMVQRGENGLEFFRLQNSFGFSVGDACYYGDGYRYDFSGPNAGGWAKTPMSEETFLTMDDPSWLLSGDISDEQFAGAEALYEKDGTVTAVFRGTGPNTMPELFTAYMHHLNPSTESSHSVMFNDVPRLEVSYTSRGITSVYVDMDISYSRNGDSYTYAASVKTEVLALGDDVIVPKASTGMDENDRLTEGTPISYAFSNLTPSEYGTDGKIDTYWKGRAPGAPLGGVGVCDEEDDTGISYFGLSWDEPKTVTYLKLYGTDVSMNGFNFGVRISSDTGTADSFCQYGGAEWEKLRPALDYVVIKGELPSDMDFPDTAEYTVVLFSPVTVRAIAVDLRIGNDWDKDFYVNEFAAGGFTSGESAPAESVESGGVLSEAGASSGENSTAAVAVVTVVCAVCAAAGAGTAAAVMRRRNGRNSRG